MVINKAISRFEKKRMSYFFWYGLLATLIAAFFAYNIFKIQSDLIMIFFTKLGIAPIIYYIIRSEEKFDIRVKKEFTAFKHHSHVLNLYLFLFLGSVVGFLLMYLFLPQINVNTFLFKSQISTIVGSTAISQISMPPLDNFLSIMYNNLKVLIFCILLSLVYGLGAILILTWNASVIAVAIGDFIKSQFGYSSLIFATTYGFLKFTLHGIPEISAYFLGGLAGGILSVAAIRHSFKTKAFFNVIRDATWLVNFSFLLLIIAAFIEAYITPIIF